MLIPKNTPLPCSVTKAFKTLRAGQQVVSVRVVEGESERPEACTEVGVVTVAPLPAGLPAGWPIHVSYSYSANGRLKVTAQVKGQAAGMTTTFTHENSHGDEQLRQWAKRFSKPKA